MKGDRRREEEVQKGRKYRGKWKWNRGKQNVGNRA